MDPRLNQALIGVRRQFQQLRYWQTVAVVCAIAVLAVFACVWQIPAVGIAGNQIFQIVLCVVCFATVAGWIVSNRSLRSPRTLATILERKYPDLQERLLAAVDQKPDESGRFTYLQRRVVDKSLAHQRQHDWKKIVSGFQLNLTQFATVAFLVLLVFGLGRLVGRDIPVSATQQLAELPLEGMEFRVQPGNVEIEKGSSVVVTAKFAPESVPSEVDLVAIHGDKTLRSRMARNLDDPTFGGYLAEVTEDMTYRIEAGNRISEDFTVTVFEYPKMLRTDAVIAPPEYSYQPQKTIENTLRVTVAEGTELTWKIHLNKPVESATLVEKEGQRIELLASTDSELLYTTDVLLTQSKRWTLELVDQQGRKNKFPPQLVARVLPNRPAELKLVSGGDATVSPIEELPIEAEVKDDFGIQRVGLTYTIGVGEPQEVELSSPPNAESGPSKSQKIRHVVDLEQADAEADQLVSYHFWAEDAGPDGKVRRTTGDMFFAEVRPFEQIFREGSAPGGQSQPPPSAAEQQQAQQAEELAELQKQIVSAAWNLIRRADLAVEIGSDRLADELVPDIQVVKESQATAILQLEELTENLPPDRSPELVEIVRDFMQNAASSFQQSIDDGSRIPLDRAMSEARSAYQALLRLRAREFDIVQQQNQQQQSASASRSNMQRQIDQLELKNDPNRYEEERTAQPQQQTPAQQAQQVLNRLKDLARRQADLNEQIKAAELELQMAETEDEKEDVARKLERLREQQQELLQDIDNLASDLDAQPEADQATQQASQQLKETRENVQESQQALQQQNPSEALAAGSRAERSLDELQEDFQKESAAALAQRMEQLKNQSQQLVDSQEKLSEKFNALDQPSEGPGLRTENNDRQETAQDLQNQSDKLDQLMEEIREAVLESEESQPLLANQLYEAQSEAQRAEVSDEMRLASELLTRGFDQQARDTTDSATRAIKQLDQSLQRAANSILGDPTEALTRARDELEELSEKLESERGQQAENNNDQSAAETSDQQSGQPQPNQEGPNQQDQPNQQGQGSESNNTPANDQSQNQQQPGGQPGEQQPGEQQGGDQPGGQQAGEQQPTGQRSEGEQSGGPQPGGQQPSGQQPGSQSGSSQGGGGLLDGSWTENFGDDEQARPITGEGFREWAEQLRQVEDMLPDSELRSRAAGIRDRARELRREVTRHANAPRWSEIEDMLAEPLRQLRIDVNAELLRRSAERNAVVPMDRDPVPEQFSEAVRKYYEQVGAGR